MRLFIVLLSFLLSSFLYTQPEQGLRVAVDESGAVFVYHTQMMPIGSGFNIYRADGNTRNFVKLNGENPIKGIESATELPMWTRQSYPYIQNQLNESDPITIMARLRSDAVSRNMFTFLFPEMANALGQLYVDTTAVLGQTVTYKIETLTATGRNTGKEFTTTVTLNPDKPLPPIDLKLVQEGRIMNIAWKYPAADFNEDDKVIQFAVMRQSDVSGASFERINVNNIIREANKTDYQFSYIINQTEGEEKVFVVPVMITGRAAQRSQMQTLALKDNQAPPIPSGIVATPIKKTIQVSWDAVTARDIGGYFVWRKESADGTLRKLNERPLNPLQTLFTDSTVVGGYNFYYAVSAIDKSGNESEASAPNVSRPPDTTPPPAPRNLKAILQPDKSIRLTWEGQVNQDLKSYLILRRFRQHQDEKAYLQLNEEVTKNQMWIDNDLKNKDIQEGGGYMYAVVAQDEAKNISDTTFFAFKMPDFTPPEAPERVFVENDRGFRVKVSWTASSSVDVVKYKINRVGVEGSQSADLGEMSRFSDLRMLDETVVQTRKYQYRIVAIDSLGNVSQESLSDTVWVRDTNAPREVRNVRANKQENGRVLVTWEPTIADDLSAYRIYRCPRISTGIYEQVGEVNATTLQWVDGQYEPNMWYLVTAVDGSENESKRSEPIEVWSKE